MPEQPERTTDPSGGFGTPDTSDATDGTTGDTSGSGMPEPDGDAERRRRRARFLRELAEARELRDRVQPRRAKAARLRHAMRMRTFRW
ncbi:hypothetical protein [Streptomyces sp. NPDC102462]|uniref:hypothetical protein n=1 Tax=Streptomyces sp. NPDC102462 TaxID=3366178 RepID=UPI003809182A